MVPVWQAVACFCGRKGALVEDWKVKETRHNREGRTRNMKKMETASVWNWIFVIGLAFAFSLNARGAAPSTVGDAMSYESVAAAVANHNPNESHTSVI
jgi:hypothetical protein